MFCAHILSGLSHIDEWIRDDALEFLDMINTQAPSASYDSRAPVRIYWLMRGFKGWADFGKLS